MDSQAQRARARVSILAGHIARKETAGASGVPVSGHSELVRNTKSFALVDFTAPLEDRQQNLKEFLKHAEDRLSKDVDLLNALPGPMDDAYLKKMCPNFRDRVHHVIAASTRWPGKNMLYNLELSEIYSGVCTPLVACVPLDFFFIANGVTILHGCVQ